MGNQHRAGSFRESGHQVERGYREMIEGVLKPELATN